MTIKKKPYFVGSIEQLDLDQVKEIEIPVEASETSSVVDNSYFTVPRLEDGARYHKVAMSGPFGT